MVFGVSPDSSTISTSPDLTTKNLKSRSPTSKSVSPSRYRLSFVSGQRSERGHLGLVELGEGDGVQVVLGHVSTSSGATIRLGLPQVRRWPAAAPSSSAWST